MRIGITGCQGVGKTTLLNALRNRSEFRDYTFCDEVTRWVKNLGFDINETGNDITQELIVMKHIFNLEMYLDMITDRTIIDCYIYSQYLQENGMISYDTLKMVKQAHDYIVNGYDYIFYIEPEFEIEDDGVRSTNPYFQARIDELFQKYMENSERNIIKISGSVEERVKEVLHTITGNTYG